MRNPYATKGRKLQSLIATKRIFRSYVFDPGNILEVLDRITIPEGMALRCHLIDLSRHCTGDKSFLYVCEDEVPEDDNKYGFIDETWKNITVEPSAMGMWQVYLLMTTIHVMPFYWHGGYDERTFVFSRSDLRRIPELRWKSLSHIEDSKLQPEVKFTRGLDGECMGMISNTYWTEWGGLIRETVIIDMDEDKIIRYGSVFNEVLFRYDSGMCY
jgi:hypothetical protein